MLNRPAAAHAESPDLSDLETKAARRAWNPALHPRDSKGRFIETGGTVRLWGGKLARVVRALPNDRILVQDQTGPDEFNGRRHTTSAKWVSMVARPDGSAPTADERKVVDEDARRTKDPRRGNGVGHDDDGDPTTPNQPHGADDQGQPIGDDDGDGPDDEDDQDEPDHGRHPVNVHALPNKRHAAGSRFKDTAAVRQHFTQLADRPGQKPEMSTFLHSIAGDDDLRTTRSGNLAILRDDATGRWYLTATGTGQRMTGAGDFANPQEAARFATHLENTARTGGPQGFPFDFSNPDLDHAARSWKTGNGENIQAAITRARAEFDAAPAPAKRGAARRPRPAAGTPGTPAAPAAPPTPAEAGHPSPEQHGSHQPTDHEQQRLEELRSRPPVADLTDEQLRAEYDELVGGDFRNASPLTQGPFESRLEDVKRERRDRDKRALTNRGEPSSLTTEQLRQEQAELARTRTSYETDDVAEVRKQRAAAVDAEVHRRDSEGSSRPDEPGSVTLSPDDVSQQLDAVRPEGSKAPSSMSDGEIRDEIVDLMEREMANGGELPGVDRTRLQVLEAEEARRAGRAPKREEKPKPPAEEPGGLFDVEPDQQQRFVADPDNPDDQADDPFGTPDMFADAEGRDTSRLRAPLARRPADFQVGDRFVGADGRTHTVKEPPLRTSRGRVRVVDEDGQEHLLAPDKELRVLHPDEDAPEVPEANAPDADAPEAEAPSADTPDSGTPTVDAPEAGAPTPDTADVPDANATPEAGPDNATAPDAPIRTTSPADMTDDDIEAELEELLAWQRRHVSSTGEGPRVQGSAMLALSPVANRRGDLHEEQRKRSLARRDREKRETEKQERAAALGRAEIGKRNDDGSYPVTVDGSEAGSVRQLARKWEYTNENGDTSSDFYGSRAEAVVALVRNRDVRQKNDAQHAQQDQARRQTPDGWTLGDRADVAENDIIRIPRMGRDRDGRPYPESWGGPRRVTSVEHQDDGTTIVRFSNPDGSYAGGGPLFLRGPDDTFAWAHDRTRPEPTPAWRHELRPRMADIGDDIASLRNHADGLDDQDQERMRRLGELIRRVGDGDTEDLQADLRTIRDEAAWLEERYSNEDLPYETRRYKSWAVAAHRKAQRALDHPDFQHGSTGDGPDNAPDGEAPNGDGRATRARDLFGEGMNAVGGDSLPEMQELHDRLDRADSADDRDAELRDVADRMDALADMYELAGPQGEHAADRFRRAARIARGDQDDDHGNDRDDRHDTEEGGDHTPRGGQDDDGSTRDGTQSDDSPEGQGDAPDDESTDSAPDRQQDDRQDDDQPDRSQDDEESRRQRHNGDPDGGAPDPDGGPDGAGTPDTPDDSSNDSDRDGSHPDDEQDAPNPDEADAPDETSEEDDDEEKRRRRRRRRRNRGGGPGGGGPGGPGGPGLPHLNLPHLNTPAGGSGDGDGRGRHGRGHQPTDGHHAQTRHADVDSLRNAWRRGEGLTPAEDTPERRTHLAELADREGLALSPDGGLALYPEQQADGSTVWRFAQARNGSNLPGLALTTDDPEQARTLAGRFEEITDGNGDAFDWHQPWGPAAIAAWRDGEGRSLPQALHAVQHDYEQERAGAYTLPDDLTTLADHALENAFRQGLGPEDTFRLMAEMDRRDGYTDQRIRAAVPDTPPADADEAERRGRAMDEALGFGDTDVTQPAPATPGRLRREYDALDEERFQDAMRATGGRMLSAEAETEGVDARAVFSGRKYSNKRAAELASPELKRWLFGDDEHDGNGRMTYDQYRQREADRVLRSEFADFDEARLRAAIDATNGYFIRREHRHSGLDEHEVFSGGSLSARDRWRQYASEELQEWLDDNGGRVTFAQYKQQRRDNDRRDREEWEAEQRRQAPAPDAEPDAQSDAEPQNGDAPDERSGQEPEGGAGTRPTPEPAPAPAPADTQPSDGGRLLISGPDTAGDRPYNVLLPGTSAPLFRTGFSDPERAREVARVLEGITDADGNPFPWDAPDAVERARTWRSADGNTLFGEAAERLNGVGNLYEPWNSDRGRALSSRQWHQQEADWHTRENQAGYTVRADPADLRPGDEISYPMATSRGQNTNARDHHVGTVHATVTGEGRPFHYPSQFSDLGNPQIYRYRAEGSWTNQYGERTDLNEAFPNLGVVRRRPRPGEASTPAEEPQREPDPEPINGQPASWARVADLTPGDMVRMEGTTRRGRPNQRVGYVSNAPVRVEVTRRGRTEHMWRTWVTQNPDGTGAAGNVFTSINANAARATAPDDAAPGGPVSGAQAALRSGDLPDSIPTDPHSRGLFPGSTVTGANDRHGTVRGATTNTVSVHWSDGTNEPAVSPTTLTVTDSQRPDGWTPAGQRVTPHHVVSDSEGTLLGPVDEVDGDNVTINTPQGSVTRSAGDLRVTGTVRDDITDTDPVTGIDTPTAADLKEDDVVVLDLDGHLATVAITSPPRQDGDRVTLDYADTTTGEVGEIDVDARAVLPRAQGPDGHAPDLGPDNAPPPDDELIVHEPPHRIDPVTGPTVDPDLDPSDRDVIGDHASGSDDDPDAQQAAARITADLPVTPEQAQALAAQLRASADPSTREGRAALRAADHLDRAGGRTPPAGLDRPRPSNAGQVSDGDLIAMPDDRRGGQVRVFRVIDAEDGPGGVRSFLLEDEDQQWRRRIVHGAMPVWQLPEAEPDPVTPPDIDDTDAPDAPSTPDTPSAPGTPGTPGQPRARLHPGVLRVGDVIDAPTSRTGYQLNGHRRLTIISEPRRNGWWMQLTGVDDDGNVHDFGLHSGRPVDVYDRNRPTPALPPVSGPRDPNPAPQSGADRIVSDHPRAVASRIIDEAIAGTQGPGGIHALREGVAARLTPEALRDARRQARRDANASLDAAGLTDEDRAAVQQRLKRARQDAHAATVRAALRTVNDLEPLPGESDEDLAARARDLLRLIPDQISNPPGGRPNGPNGPDAGGDPDVAGTVAGHVGGAVNALINQLQAAGVDPGDADQLARTLLRQLDGSRQTTARRIARRVAAASPAAGRQPGLLARIVALLLRMGKRLVELVKAGGQKIAEKYRAARDRMRRLRAFLGRLARRVRNWPESRRLARLHRAVNLPTTDGETLAARISHWAGLMPEPGRFGQSQQRVSFWRPTSWGRLAAGRLPGRSDRIRWSPDRAADGGPGLTALRHMAALRAAGSDVDQDVTRRLSAALGDDFGHDPHAALQHADDYVAASERRLVNLQAARASATIPDDQDLDIEITAARAELASARREYADMRAQYAAAVPGAVAAALADVRDMGPEGSTSLVFGPGSDPDAERAVRGVQRLIPRSWLNTPQARRVTVVDGDAGSYDADGQRITVADLADDGLGTAGHALAQHLAQHLGDLDVAQRAYWFTRTHTGRPGARRMRPNVMSRLLRRQQTQPDTGDSFARSVQAMFNGDWYLDDDLRAFLLGLLATR
ncbi:hypothetical protein [Streptomyces similanensis]